MAAGGWAPGCTSLLGQGHLSRTVWSPGCRVLGAQQPLHTSGAQLCPGKQAGRCRPWWERPLRMAPCSRDATDARLTPPRPHLDPAAPKAPPRPHNLLEWGLSRKSGPQTPSASQSPGQGLRAACCPRGTWATLRVAGAPGSGHSWPGDASRHLTCVLSAGQSEGQGPERGQPPAANTHGVWEKVPGQPLRTL